MTSSKQKPGLECVLTCGTTDMSWGEPVHEKSSNGHESCLTLWSWFATICKLSVPSPLSTLSSMTTNAAEANKLFWRRSLSLQHLATMIKTVFHCVHMAAIYVTCNVELQRKGGSCVQGYRGSKTRCKDLCDSGWQVSARLHSGHIHQTTCGTLTLRYCCAAPSQFLVHSCFTISTLTKTLNLLSSWILKLVTTCMHSTVRQPSKA